MYEISPLEEHYQLEPWGKREYTSSTVGANCKKEDIWGMESDEMNFLGVSSSDLPGVRLPATSFLIIKQRWALPAAALQTNNYFGKWRMV